MNALNHRFKASVKCGLPLNNRINMVASESSLLRIY